jgi:hypothetical protein
LRNPAVPVIPATVEEAVMHHGVRQKEEKDKQDPEKHNPPNSEKRRPNLKSTSLPFAWNFSA